VNIAFFDMDGTITRRDSLIHFISYTHGYPRLGFGLLIQLPYLIAYKFGLYPNDKTKERFLKYFFGGWEKERFDSIATQYSNHQINHIIRPQALERIKWHQQQGDKTVVVTASIENWLKEWCDRNGLELISTQLFFEDNKVTGNFSGRNCHGEEKVRQIKEKYNLTQYDTVYAYGDSSGDREMLQLADKPYFRYFS
jgi:HAD superfamily hydrolase (TIGR01490 family)